MRAMLRLFLVSLKRLLHWSLRILFPGSGGGRSSPRRMLAMALFVPVFALLQGLHWLGFLLDELLFRNYRQVDIREPVFIVGVPRSGTTHLHRVLARDPQYTTFSTWECLLAPSVVEKRLWLGAGRIDRSLGRPLGRLLGWLPHHVLGAFDDVHPMRLEAPEEDYLTLLPVLASFILVLPFPGAEFLWHMGRFDRDMPPREGNLLLDYYRRCLQKHLYVFGADKRLLSKNAAFAPLAHNLARNFPDARWVVCVREPEAATASLQSSLGPGLRFFDSLSVTPDLRRKLTNQLAFAYQNLLRLAEQMASDRCACIQMTSLMKDLVGTVGTIYRRLGLRLHEDFSGHLEMEAVTARGYRSRHRYRLEEFGLSADTVHQQMGASYQQLAARCDAVAGSASALTGSPASAGNTNPPQTAQEQPC